MRASSTVSLHVYPRYQQEPLSPRLKKWTPKPPTVAVLSLSARSRGACDVESFLSFSLPLLPPPSTHHCHPTPPHFPVLQLFFLFFFLRTRRRPSPLPSNRQHRRRCPCTLLALNLRHVPPRHNHQPHIPAPVRQLHGRVARRGDGGADGGIGGGSVFVREGEDDVAVLLFFCARSVGVIGGGGEWGEGGGLCRCISSARRRCGCR